LIGRLNYFTWDVTSTVGISNAYEKDSPYFPIGLPSVAGLAASQSNNVFGGSSTNGVSFSYGFAAVVQYRVNPYFVVGARLNIDHSHDYAPSSGMIYARIAFSARKDDFRISPTPVRLYSSY
jgi:hypothetical protein